MQTSSKLGLSYILPQRAQKHVTVNESLRRLDVVVQTSVISATTLVQPVAPTDGDAYILPTGKTGAVWATLLPT